MSVTDQLDRLAAFEPAPYPVVSLYLNTQSGSTGKDQFETFVRKEFAARREAYPANSPDREHLERDFEAITEYLQTELEPSANGVAIFACSAAELFETVQLTAPIEQHWLFIGDRPHLYPLARLESKYPRYAAVLADTHSSRILVFATGELVTEQEVKGVKTRRTSQGGWSQARFQRHIENFHLQHVKELIEALEQVVQREGIDEILLAGDDVVIPLVREQMPKHLADKVVDHMRIDTNAAVHEVLSASLEAMNRVRAQSEREKVEAAVGAYRAGGLGVVRPEPTLDALLKGQVDELLLASSLRELQAVTGARARGVAEANDAEPATGIATAGEAAEAPSDAVQLADELVTRATQTGAKITFVEDAALLSEYGGVAALLRFRI
jgi:peptide chain release factor subunit 1